MDRYTLEQIRNYWTEQARQYGASPEASWSDLPVIGLEIREIAKYLQEGDRVLDAGCANGYTTLHLAAQKKVSMLGVDYIPEMIVKARETLEQSRGMLLGSAEFEVGDILALNGKANFDKVVVVRVLINLRTFEKQAEALAQCASALKPGGLLLLSEATVQGWRKLNAMRNEWGLPSIPVPPFNEYMDEELLLEQGSRHFELVDIVNFASTYYVASRVFKPLLAQALHSTVNVANPDMEWNRFWAQMPQVGDYGTQKLFVWRRR